MSPTAQGPAVSTEGATVSFGPLLASIKAKCAPSQAATTGTESQDPNLDVASDEVQMSQATDIVMGDDEEVAGGLVQEDTQDIDDIYAPEVEEAPAALDTTHETVGGRRLTRSATAKTTDLRGDPEEPVPTPAASLQESTKARASPPGKKAVKSASSTAKAANTEASLEVSPSSPAPPVVTTGASSQTDGAPSPDVGPPKKEKKSPGRPPKKPHECPTEDLFQKVAALAEDSKSHDKYTKNLAASLAAARKQVDEKQRKIDAQQTRMDEQQRKMDGQQAKFEEHLRNMDAKMARLDDYQRQLNEQRRSLTAQETKAKDLVRRVAALETTVNNTSHELEHHFLPILTNVDAFMGTTQSQLQELDDDVARALDHGGELAVLGERVSKLEATADEFQGLGKRSRPGSYPARATPQTPPPPRASVPVFQAQRQAVPSPSPFSQGHQQAAFPTTSNPSGARTASVRVGPVDARGRSPFVAFKSYLLAVPGGNDMMAFVGRVRVDSSSSEHLIATINPSDQADRLKSAWNGFEFPRAPQRPFATVAYQGN